MKPELYAKYDRQQAVSLFGSEAAALNLCDGQWLIFPNQVICFADIGEAPDRSHFVNGSSFVWVADKPYRVNPDDWSPSIPLQVIEGEAKSRSIHLFVRPKATGPFVYLGRLEPSTTQMHPRQHFHGAARFDLRPTLPSALWIEWGGLRPGDLDHQAVDRALDVLKGQTTVHDRLKVLERLVTYWHGPIGPKGVLPESETEAIKIPMPLRWWYSWAGGREDIMTGMNTLEKPASVRMENDHLLFYLETEACYRWATLPEGDDPPVFGRESINQAWRPEGITLSEHLILACLFEAIMTHSRYGAAGSVERETLTRIERVILPIAVGAWRWWGSTRFYARNGAFMLVQAEKHLYIGAKTEKPLQFLRPFLNTNWEYTAV